VLVGGPGSGKTHLATAIGLSGIVHHGKRVRFYSTVDLANALEQEGAKGPRRTDCGEPLAPSPGHSGRTRVSALQPGRRGAVVPSAQPPVRTHERCDRLKFLKGQMYGRAGFQLLRTRALNRY
jgi:IstB-like ATP binding protein